MPKLSAGILLYKIQKNEAKVFLVHPGGPFWAKKDTSSWSLPKGEYLPSEDPWAAAQREFYEEVGVPAPKGARSFLGEVSYNNKKVVAWALQSDLVVNEVKSNTFNLEWPPRSGGMQDFPEVDRAEWFSLPQARQKLVKAQVLFIDRLEATLF